MDVQAVARRNGGVGRFAADGWEILEVRCGLHGIVNGDLLGFAIWKQGGPDRSRPWFARRARHSGHVTIGGDTPRWGEPLSDVVKCRGGKDAHRLACDPVTLGEALRLAEAQGSSTVFLSVEVAGPTPAR